MTDSTRPTMRKRLREMKELVDTVFWHVLDLRIMIQKAETELTTAELNSSDAGSGVLGEVENHEDYRPGASPEQNP